MDDGLESAPLLAAWLREQGDCECEAGLSPTELELAEGRFGISFPPIWRAVLGLVHPIALPEPPRGADGVRAWTRFPDWRLRDASAEHLIARPIEGLLFDVERNDFWCRAWGTRPGEMADRLDAAARELANVPHLIPLWGYWHIAESDDSPVFSISQADLYIPYLTIPDLLTGRSEDAVELDDYPIGGVPFWSDLHAWSQIGHLGRWGDFADAGQ